MPVSGLARQLAFGLATILFPPTLPAQTPPSCTDIASRVSAGQPGPDDLALLMDCPAERGPAFASYLQTLRASTDQTTLEEPFALANIFRDADVYEALSSIAVDAGASELVRNLSLLALIFYENGSSSLTYAGLTAVPDGGVCQVGGLGEIEDHLVIGSPLPADHQARAGALAANLARNAAVPASVRSAARCLAAAARFQLLPGLESLVGGDATKIAAAYACGNKFVVRNGNFTPENVTYQVQKSREQATLVVPPRTQTKAFGEVSFVTSTKATIKIIYNGRQIQTEANKNIACP